MPTAFIQAQDTLEPLPWDSQHFGFHVARIKEPELGELELRQALVFARRTENRLVYWAADPRIEVPQSILGEFHGLLVDRKVTFRKTLTHLRARQRFLDVLPHCRASQERAQIRCGSARGLRGSLLKIQTRSTSPRGIIPATL